MNPLIIGAIVAGIAGAAVADGIELAGAKTAAHMQNPLGDRSSVQFWLARAKARTDAARALIYETANRAIAYLEDEDLLSIDLRIDCLLAGSNATESATEAVDLVQRVVGISGVRMEGRFQQYFRDIHTVNQHAFGSENRYETAGQLMLGKPADLAWVYA